MRPDIWKIRPNLPRNLPVLPSDDLYAEWDDIHTIKAMEAALASRHQVTLVEANLDAFETYRQIRPDLVFNIAEGLYGASREAQIPAMLDMLGIPYTGSDPLTLGLCLDKRRTKEILAHNGIATPRVLLWSNRRPKFPAGLRLSVDGQTYPRRLKQRGHRQGAGPQPAMSWSASWSGSSTPTGSLP